MTSSALNRHIMAQKGIFGLSRNDHNLVYYPIISYQRIQVYRVEKMDMGIFIWINGVSGKCNPSKYYSNYCMWWNILVAFI